MKEDNARPKSNRRTWILLACLFGVTTALGFGTRSSDGRKVIGCGPMPPVCGPMPPVNPPATVTAGPLSLSYRLDGTAVQQGQEGLVRMELVIAAAEREGLSLARLPTDLVVVLDKSGSMSGAKLTQAKAAITELISQLGSEDRFGLVSFSTRADLTVPLTEVRETNTHALAGRVASVPARGGTNMSAGLDLANSIVANARQAGRAPRIILISDGEANEGDPTPAGLARRASVAAEGEYVLSAVGVGQGFNEQVMTAVADAGTGNFYFIEQSGQLAGIFRGEFEAARDTVATGVAVNLHPAPGVTVVEAAGYPLSYTGQTVSFRPGAMFSGQERRIWVTWRVPTHEARELDLGHVSMGGRVDGDVVSLSMADIPKIACVATRADYVAKLDTEAWADSVAGEEYNAVRQKVAKAVKEGKREEALSYLADFDASNSSLNADVQSPAVAGVITESLELRAEVEEAFTGRDQQTKQNSLGKKEWSEAQERRRAGSRKVKK